VSDDKEVTLEIQDVQLGVVIEPVQEQPDPEPE
jgi:hypothetical protein